MKELNRRTRLQAIALGSAGLVAGAVIAMSGVANAADSSTPSPSVPGATQSAPAAPQGQLPPNGAAGSHHGVPGGPSPVRADEKAVTAEQKATLTAAAEKAVPGGTVVRVETDAGDAAFEAHMTKADGTAVTVKFDERLAVTAVEDGMGIGDPSPQGAPQGAPQGGAGGTA